MRNSPRFSNTDENDISWWVWFLLTFPFITYFTLISSAGNKTSQACTPGAASHYTWFCLFILFHFLFYFKLSVLRKGTLFKHILGHSFLPWCLLKLFLTSCNEENQGSCGLYERGRQWKTKVVFWQWRDKGLCGTWDQTQRIHREEHPRNCWVLGTKGHVWGECRYLCLHHFFLSFFFFSIFFLTWQSASFSSLFLVFVLLHLLPPFHFHANYCGKTEICEFTILSPEQVSFPLWPAAKNQSRPLPPVHFPVPEAHESHCGSQSSIRNYSLGKFYGKGRIEALEWLQWSWRRNRVLDGWDSSTQLGWEGLNHRAGWGLIHAGRGKLRIWGAWFEIRVSRLLPACFFTPCRCFMVEKRILETK